MAWYYKNGDAVIGPISKAQLQELIKSKQVTARAMVRSVEMERWQPLADVIRGKKDTRNTPSSPPAQASAGVKPAASETASLPTAIPTTAVCSQCGRSLPQDQMVSYDHQVICAACKPMFVQKLKEGVATPRGALQYAGFWIRFVAKTIDWIVMIIAQWGVMIPLGMLTAGSMSQSPGQMPSAGFFIKMGVQLLIGMSIPVLYNTLFVGRFAATPCKMACRLKIVTPDGGQVSYLRALGRTCGEIVTQFTFSVGYIIAAFDSEKRALHDRICSTRVVHK